MPARLSAWLQLAAGWGKLFPLAIGFAVALIEAIVLPRRLWAKAAWVSAIVPCAVLAGVVMRAELQGEERARQGREVAEIAALHGLWDQWDRLSRALPAAGGPPAASFDTVEDALASLSARSAAIGGQIAALEAQRKGRSIDDETAAKLADYLRSFGGYPVVVSCVPDDVEAYDYANRLATILRAAGWDARGPELSAARADAAAMGVTVFVRDPHAPDAARILLDGFTRFNIPYRSGIAASEDIPDTATVELFVAKKP